MFCFAAFSKLDAYNGAGVNETEVREAIHLTLNSNLV
jgi:hypothetical protein